MKNKRDRLVPFEKSERVIRLERRGKKQEVVPGAMALILLGVIFLCYCVAIFICGFGSWFFLVWGAMGLCCILLGCCLNQREWMETIPRWLKAAVLGGMGLGLLLFCTVEGLILSEFGARANPGADYMIILGAQWKESGPSEVLRRRLDRAVTYLKDNPDTTVIVSGGRGDNEPIAEAVGMREYLLQAGIEEERILTEENSANTSQNLMYSAQLLNRETDRVVLVTNNFHMFRALKIAEKQGYLNVEGLAASSSAGFLPNNMLREFLSVIKNFVLGNM